MRRNDCIGMDVIAGVGRFKRVFTLCVALGGDFVRWDLPGKKIAQKIRCWPGAYEETVENQQIMHYSRYSMLIHYHTCKKNRWC